MVHEVDHWSKDMRNPAIEAISTLETLVARRICTSVIATGPDGVGHWVRGEDVTTTQFPVGQVHHFGPVAINEADVILSQFDDRSGVILLMLADGSSASIQIVANDTEIVIL